jgi:hypothetical protein
LFPQTLKGFGAEPMIKPALLAAALIAPLLLAACETPMPTIYAPAPGPRAVGFSELRLEPGRYRITYRGGPGAPPTQVSDYALLRASDLALRDGYDWFRVSDRHLDRVGYAGGSSVSFGVGGASFGRHSAVGVGVGQSFPLGDSGVILAQTLEVMLGKGPPPRDADVYDAREIRRAIGPRTGPPMGPPPRPAT